MESNELPFFSKASDDDEAKSNVEMEKPAKKALKKKGKKASQEDLKSAKMSKQKKKASRPGTKKATRFGDGSESGSDSDDASEEASSKKKATKKDAAAKSNEETVEVPLRLDCHQTVEGATYAYRCGVFFDVRNKTSTPLTVTGLVAGAKGGPRNAIVWACDKGASSGNEMNAAAWRQVGFAQLLEKHSTTVALHRPVVVPAASTVGFLLHSDTYAVYHSAENRAASNETMEILPGLRSTEARSLKPFQANYLSSDRATHAGAVVYRLGAPTKSSSVGDSLDEDDVRAAFEKALVEGSAPLMRAKLSVVGEGRAGKTSTVRALLALGFDRDQRSTVGAVTSACEIDRTETCDFVKVQQDASEELEAHIRKAAIRSLVDLQSKSIDDVREAGCAVRDTGGSSSSPLSQGKQVDDDTSAKERETGLGVEEGQASDGFEDQREREYAEAYAEAAKAEAGEVAKKISAVDVAADVTEFKSAGGASQQKLKLSVWDYGGQRVFYDLHHLFLTRQALYLCVFDMQKLAAGIVQGGGDKNTPEETNGDRTAFESLGFLQFWLRSLKLHAAGAPIALVGTHKDVVSDPTTHRLIHDRIIQAFARTDKGGTSAKSARLLAPVVYNGDLVFFPVDNSIGLRDPVVRSLKAAIRTTILSEAYVAENTPVKWLKLLDAFERHDKPWLSFDEALDKAKSAAGLGEAGVQAALAKFHEIGLLNWWGDAPTLRQRVILDPQILVDKISLVVRDFDLHGFGRNYHDDKRLARAALKLREQALLSESLFAALLREDTAASTAASSGDDQDKTRFFFNDDANFVKELMLRMAIICAWPSRSAEPTYLVPSLLIPSKQCVGVEEMLPWSKSQTLILDFPFFLPTGLFERLVCMLVPPKGRSSAVVNSTDAWLTIEDVDFHLLNDEVKQQLRCEVFYQLLDRHAANSFVLTLVVRTLDRLRDHFARNLRYKVLVPSSFSSDHDVEYSEMSLTLTDSRFSHWHPKLTASESIETHLKQEVPRLEALFRLGRDYARRVMAEDRKGYATVWDHVRVKHLDELVELEALVKDVVATQHAGGSLSRASLRQPSFGESTVALDNDVYLDLLYEASEEAKEAFYQRVQNTLCVDGVQFFPAPSLKKRGRALEKIRLKYDGDASRLRDVLRCKCVARDVRAVLDFVNNLRSKQSDDFAVVSVKLKLCESFDADALSGGYRDLNVNVRLDTGLLVELQLHLKAFDDMQAKLRASKAGGGLTGHDRYVIYRRVNERLEFQKARLDRLLKHAGSDDHANGGPTQHESNLVASLRREVADLRAELKETKDIVQSLCRAIQAHPAGAPA